MIADTTMIKNWGFSIEELEVKGTEADSYTASMVRLYRDSLDGARLQIRHLGLTSKSGVEKPRMMVADAALTIKEAKELAARLNEIVAAAEEYAATGVPVGF